MMINAVVPSRAPASPYRDARAVASDFAADRIAEELVSLVAPASVAADQYRSLRYCIENGRAETGRRVFAVTSPSPGDGKTVTTLNLAGALAQADGARILVIDADLRKPSVAPYLGLVDARRGLVDALRAPSYELNDVARRIAGFNLWVVPAGRPEASPYELLSSPRLDAIVAQARRDFDCVLIDTPPAVLMPDCRLIERSVDGVLLVVAANKTPRSLVSEALNGLNPDKLFGFVFNADDRPSARYYGYYGQYGSTSQTQSRPFWRRLFFLP
ncbi:MAG TPA: CpsD/CapB family tyrosine-protein kinase [Vicinamibacterales bacterium]|nr:CpsD/CapB family tyrosine-protein kinase [Vicinamibacterales bacterium]